MGCGGSKAVAAVQPVGDTANGKQTTESDPQLGRPATGGGDGGEEADGPAALDQPDPTSTALNAPPLPSPRANNTILKPISPPAGIRQANGNGSAIAFEIQLQSGDSLIQRHPPKRFQRLEDNQLTMEMFQGKHADAADRRNKLLNDRVQSARARNLRSAGRAKSRSTMRSDDDPIEGGMDDSHPQAELT